MSKTNTMTIVNKKISKKEQIDKYIDEDIIAFSCHIGQVWDETAKKFKKTYDRTPWKHLTLENTYVNERFNSIAIVTGKKSGIFVLDIDDMEDYYELLKLENRNCIMDNNVCVRSGNGGVHIYFKYDETLADIKTKSKCFYKYPHLKLDTRNDNGIIFAPGSSYMNDNVGEVVTYEWINGDSVFNTNLNTVPKWLKKLLLEGPPAKSIVVKEMKNIVYVETTLGHETVAFNDEMMADIIDCINPHEHEAYSKWVDLCFAMSCERRAEFFKYFLAISQKMSNFGSEEDCLNKWNSCCTTTPANNRKLTYNSLMYWAKIENIDKYEEFKTKHFKKDMNDEDITINDTVIVDQEYLTIDNSVAMNNINEFMSGETKNLLIKSPYATGKTSMLQQILSQYNHKKVLFVTYRITLASNISGNFPEFALYTDYKCKNIDNFDKLICSLDSITKASNYYDVIILDEIESLINYFASSTLNDKRQDCYQKLMALCNSSIKNIMMDGDISNRSKHFISQMNNTTCKYIVNNKQKLNYNFQYIGNHEHFDKEINSYLENGKNIGIISMSSSMAESYYNKYKDDYESILYTGKTSDEKKRELNNVNKVWASKQLIIYSPVIESGVDFSVEHVDKLFIILSSSSNLKYCSTSQRGLMQMVARFRKFKDNDIIVYRNKLMHNDSCCIKQAISLQEVKMFYHNIFDKAIEESAELKQLLLYSYQEEANKISHVFLPILNNMLLKKGHTFENIDVKNTAKKNDNIYRNKFVDMVIEEYDFEAVDHKETKTEQEKIFIEKYYATQKYKLDFNTIVQYDTYMNKDIDLIRMLLTDYVPKNKTIENVKKIEMVNGVKKVLTVLNSNWKNDLITNNSFYIGLDKLSEKDSDDILDSIKNSTNNVLNNALLYGVRKVNITSRKQFLGRLNTLLSDYIMSCKPEYEQKQVKCNRTNTTIGYNISIDEHIKKLAMGLLKKKKEDF